MKASFLIIIAGLVFLTPACHGRSKIDKSLSGRDIQPLPQKQQERLLNTIDSSDRRQLAFADWRADSFGCLKIRDVSYANRIARFLDTVKNKESIDISEFFGPPNRKYRDGNNEYFRYGLGRSQKCDIVDSDACFFEIIRIDMKMYQTGITCP